MKGIFEAFNGTPSPRRLLKDIVREKYADHCGLGDRKKEQRLVNNISRLKANDAIRVIDAFMDHYPRRPDIQQAIYKAHSDLDVQQHLLTRMACNGLTTQMCDLVNQDIAQAPDIEQLSDTIRQNAIHALGLLAERQERNDFDAKTIIVDILNKLPKDDQYQGFDILKNASHNEYARSILRELARTTNDFHIARNSLATLLHERDSNRFEGQFASGIVNARSGETAKALIAFIASNLPQHFDILRNVGKNHQDADIQAYSEEEYNRLYKWAMGGSPDNDDQSASGPASDKKSDTGRGPRERTPEDDSVEQKRKRQERERERNHERENEEEKRKRELARQRAEQERARAQREREARERMQQRSRERKLQRQRGRGLER